MTAHILHRRNFLLHLQERPASDEPVVLKEPARQQLTRAQIAQLHNEHVITRQLAHVPGVRPVYTIEGSESHPVLLLEYIQGQSLVEIIQGQSLDLRKKLQLAVEVARILAHIHQEGVMHRDICSGNILVDENTASGEPDEVTIIDFGLAAMMRQEEPPQPVATDVVAGSLAYIAPEQTGRMHRSVDHRSDLYSLGVTLYELFTGQLPFQTDDAMEMIHAHIAVEPVPPQQRNAALPEPLSALILKLMAKNAEDRYQSALGLGADLVRCLDQLQRTGTVDSFELGQDDFSDRLQIPHRLHGRQSEISQLVATYDRVAQGNTELLFIAGYSGVGKTSLVHEIRGDVQAKGGIFVEGKFGQLQQALPYSAWEQAVTHLVNNWLAQSETALAGWRATVLDAVGDHGQILSDIIPALERIIGPQPEVPQLGGIENQNRLHYYFNRFVSSVATPEHPLVVFLDDMQWIDLASLNLMEALIADHSRDCLLIIGAYRNNEVGPGHPLMASQDKMRAESDQVRVFTLRDLAPADVDHLLADTLRLDVAECRPMGQVLMEKTAGNPFYLRQLLYALESDGLLRFHRKRRRWEWEESLHSSLQAGANVVDLMIRKIQTLPVETQRTLSVAACIGSRFETSTLGTVIGAPQMDILTDLGPALKDGLIVQSKGYYAFSHDRVQEAAYSLIPKSDLPKRELEIGRLLLANTAADDLDDQIFSIVGHLNAGRALIDTDSEKLDLARLNLVIGQKAKAASAFVDGKKYVETGLDLLGPDSWQEQYELTLSLHDENGELAYLTGQYDQIATTADLIHANAKSILDRVRIFMTQIEAETAQYDFDKALEIGLEVLRDLGIEIPSQPAPEHYQALNDTFVAVLTSNSFSTVVELPEMSDKRGLAACSLLASVMSTTYIAKPSLFPIISFNGAILTLELGLDVWSPFFLGGVALVSFASIDRETPTDEALSLVQFAKQLVEIIREMLDNPITVRSRTKGLMMLAFTVPWIEPIEQGIKIAQTTYQNGREAGDLLYASYGAIHFAIQGFAAGVNLNQYESQLSDYVDSLNRLGQKTTPQWLSIYLQTAQNFVNICSEPDELNGIFLSENDWLPGAITANDTSGRHLFYINKLMLAYHFDIDDKLDEYARFTEDFLAGALSLFSIPLFHLYSALAWLRLVGWSRLEKDARTLDLIKKSLHWLETWSKATPVSFQHKFDLVAAEKARVTGDLDGALAHYERAISGARENGFAHEEALANELYARFWLERGNERFAELFMREAYNLYQKWGALAKAEHLTKRYPDLMIGRSISLDEPRAGVVLDQMTGGLDLLTVLKASQTIATELVLDRLLGKVMNTAMENAGAQQGYLMLEEEGQWVIEAAAEVGQSETQVRQAISIDESDALAHGIVHYVARTQEPVVLGNAAREGMFIHEPYIQRNQTKSVLCTPLVNQGRINAILYLENNLATNVFSEERVALLQLLSSQMAMSIDNARTHARLEQLLEERSIALSTAETQIRSLFDNSPLGIALSTLEGGFLSVNKALLRMLRISEEEVLQRNVIDFYADRNDRVALLAEVQDSGSVQDFGVRVIRNDGSTFFASLNISRLVLEGDKVLLALVEDVTVELMAEQEIAAREERERLARELHDSVSQTLFSAGMIADATPRLWNKDSSIGQQNLELLSMLIRGASAEMRSLLLELRPDTLKDQTLGTLFEALAVAARARTGAAVSLQVEGNYLLPQDVTLTLHRIAQESLHNIAKHAEASKVVIDLSCDPERARLCIKDDGRGFDPEAIPAGHLGIGIMRERTRSIGGTFQIDSRPGNGTMVVVHWAKARDGEADEQSRAD